jgi:putative endonuclease
VYCLRCSDGSLYTGITNDLPKRLKAHAAGRASKYTRSRLPVRLAYNERQKSKSAALKREAAIKRLTRAAKLRLIVTGRARPLEPAHQPAPLEPTSFRPTLSTRSPGGSPGFDDFGELSGGLAAHPSPP